MTNAQIHADSYVRTKIAVVEPRAEFKLKRFQNVNPRTSTKRGDNGYMVLGGSGSGRRVVSSQDIHADAHADIHSGEDK